MKFLTLLASAIILTPTLTLAQGHSGAGNGGMTIVLKKTENSGKIRFLKASPLDYWEAKVETGNRNFKISLGSNELDEYKKVSLIINRIRKVDPRFAEILDQRLVLFQDLVQIENRYDINKIPDTHIVVDLSSLITPRGNEIEYQGAVQLKEIDPIFNKKFLIDAEIWHIMNRNDRAGLIFHEILYWTEIEAGASDSYGTRHLNVFFSSNLAEKISLAEYIALIRKYSKRKSISVEGGEISILPEDHPGFSVAGRILGGKLLKNLEIKEPNFETQCLESHELEFNEDGSIRDCAIASIKLKLADTNRQEEVVFSGEATSFLKIKTLIAQKKISSLPFSVSSIEYRSSQFNLENQKNPDGLQFSAEGWLIEVKGNEAVKNILAQANCRLELIQTEFEQIEIDPASGALLSLKVKAMNLNQAWIHDLNSEKKFELSWKQSGIYQIYLNSSLHQIDSVE